MIIDNHPVVNICLKCEVCGSQDFTCTDDARYQCMDCGKTYPAGKLTAKSYIIRSKRIKLRKETN